MLSTRHSTGVRCGIPRADSRALPNSSPDRSTSSELRSPPTMPRRTPPLPLPSSVAIELPTVSILPVPLIVPTPPNVCVAAISRATSTRSKSMFAFACISLFGWGVSAIVPLMLPGPTPKLSGCRSTAPSLMSSATRRLSSGMESSKNMLAAIAQLHVGKAKLRQIDRLVRQQVRAVSDCASCARFPASGQAWDSSRLRPDEPTEICQIDLPRANFGIDQRPLFAGIDVDRALQVALAHLAGEVAELHVAAGEIKIPGQAIRWRLGDRDAGQRA